MTQIISLKIKKKRNGVNDTKPIDFVNNKKNLYIINLTWKEKYEILRKKEPRDISQIAFHGYIFQNQDKLNDSERHFSNSGLFRLNLDDLNFCLTSK